MFTYVLTHFFPTSIYLSVAAIFLTACIVKVDFKTFKSLVSADAV
jgi:hypothetical protein